MLSIPATPFCFSAWNSCGSLSSITNHLRPCTDVEMLVSGLGYAWTKMMSKAEADVTNLQCQGVRSVLVYVI